MKLQHLRQEAARLSAEYEAAVADGDWDREGSVGMRQISVDEQIARIERRMARSKARTAKLWN